MLDDVIVSGLAGGLIVFIILASVRLAFFIKRLIGDVDFRKSLLSGFVGKWKRYRIILVVILGIGSLFYWYEWRPSQIKKQCNESADRESEGWEKDYDYIYKKCLHNKGL